MDRLERWVLQDRHDVVADATAILEQHGQAAQCLPVGPAGVDAEAILFRLGLPGDRLEKVADIGADPEVLQLPRVDPDLRLEALHRPVPFAARDSAAAVRSAAASQVKSAARRGPAGNRQAA